MGGRQEIPASPPSSADAAVATAAPPRLYPPDTNLPQRRRGNEAAVAGFLVLAAREATPAPLPAAAATTSHSDERGAVTAPAAEQSRIGATATRGKIGRTRPLKGSETASADPTAPPLTRAWPAGRGAACEISGEDLLVALCAAGLNLGRISARDGD